MAKVLLILGGGADQLPGVLKAQEMGIYTIVLDGNSEAYCKKYSDEFYTVSIKHIEQIDEFLDNYSKKIDGVIAFGVDIPYIIAYVANRLKINYTIPLQSAKLSENKFYSKEFMHKYNINIPAYSLVNSVDDIKKFVDIYGFPFVLKPVDNSASRGISLLHNLENINKYYEYAISQSSCNQIMVEKYLDGFQISTESFIVNSKVFNIGFADRNYEDMDKFMPNIIENGGDLPSIYMKEKHKFQLEKYLKIISKELNIRNGVIKGDIIIYKDELYIIELALRLSGGNLSTIEIPESTGVDFLQVAIKLHMNLKIDETELKIEKNDFISLRYKFLEDIKKGKIKNINLPEVNNISSSLFIKIGDEIKSNKTENHANRIASVITRGSSRDEAINKANEYLQNLEIVFE
ncbi:ATP-binding protein [Halarcobacter anaerophilus]|uniref:ATP-binding protein n=1 Tax=Halarcobacter anaerophilus TaxID=877500 RepID=UPI001162652A|nr:ATP-grasp domain-containing protein [Halarcobacter anaerophilus]QDF30226.1 ATP-grasp domain-containing protein [Halarcobacter anaerophilus]